MSGTVLALIAIVAFFLLGTFAVSVQKHKVDVYASMKILELLNEADRTEEIIKKLKI